MLQVFQIAIDGPSAAGKSTIAKAIAEALSIDYIDTGAMYRAVAYKMIKDGIDISDRQSIRDLLSDIRIDFSDGDTLLDGEVINDKIRTPKVSNLASTVSALPEVREKLVALQREMGNKKPVVMDGRDIGTNVFPKAKYKFFLNASIDERAKRRWAELKQREKDLDPATVKADILSRDYNDSHRALNPLCKANDAIEVDTTNLSIKQVTEKILCIIIPQL